MLDIDATDHPNLLIDGERPFILLRILGDFVVIVVVTQQLLDETKVLMDIEIAVFWEGEMLVAGWQDT